MIKYFIEREDGMWLMPLDMPGTSPWTRDPNKAWKFNSPGNGILPQIIPNVTGTAYTLLRVLNRERLMPGLSLKITEYEFFPYTLEGSSTPVLWVDNINKDIYSPLFGRTRVTPV